MAEIKLSMVEPFTSPAWGSQLVIFSGPSGLPIAEEDTKEYLAQACRYAKKHQVYLVPQRFVMLGKEGMCLIDPSGKVKGAQQKIYTQEGENNTKLSPVNSVFGEIFLAVDTDIYHPEIFKIIYNMGVRIVIASQYISGFDHSNHKIVSGVWNAAQSNNLLVAGVSNQFHGVCVPRSLTKQGDGFLVSPTLKMPTTAVFSLKQLDELPLRPMLTRKFYLIHRSDIIG